MMNKQDGVSANVYDALKMYVTTKPFLNGYPFKTLTTVNLGVSFVLETMQNKGPVKEAVEAVKKFLTEKHMKNNISSIHEKIEKDTQDFLFKTAFCAPAKYIPLLTECGFDVNAKRCHPMYENIENGKAYPMLVFAAYQGDCQKIANLIECGADASFVPDAALFCIKSDVLSDEEKIKCLNELKCSQLDVFAENYETLSTATQSEQIKTFLETEKETQNMLKKLCPDEQSYRKVASRHTQRKILIRERIGREQ